MDERALKYFEIVVKTGSIRRASDVLHVAPSAISRQIRELEATLDVRLLDRLGRRGVVTTDPGTLLLRYIKELRLREDNFFAEVSDLKDLRSGTLRIALGGGFVDDLITNVLREFSREYPGIRFLLNVCPGDDVLRRVRDDSADLGLLISFPSSQGTVRIPTVETLLSCGFQPLSVIVNSEHALAKKKSVSFPELQDVRLALLNESFIISHLVRTFESQHRVRLKPILTCDSFESITAFLLAGLGAAILPSYCVAREIDNGTVIAVPLVDVLDNSLSVDLVVNKERKAANVIATFSRCIENNMAAFNAALNKEKS